MKVCKYICCVISLVSFVCLGQEHQNTRVELHATDIVQVTARYVAQHTNVTMSDMKLQFELSSKGMDVIRSMLDGSEPEHLSNPLTWFENFKFTGKFNKVPFSVTRVSDSAIHLQLQAMPTYASDDWNANTVYVVHGFDGYFQQRIVESDVPMILEQILSVLSPPLVSPQEILSAIADKFIEVSFSGHAFLKRKDYSEDYDDAYLARLRAYINALASSPQRPSKAFQMIDVADKTRFLKTFKLHIQDTAILTIPDIHFPKPPELPSRCIPVSPKSITILMQQDNPQRQKAWTSTLPISCMQFRNRRVEPSLPESNFDIN